MKNHPIQDAAAIFIIVLIGTLITYLMMESIIFCYAMGAIAFIAVIIATYETSKKQKTDKRT